MSIQLLSNQKVRIVKRANISHLLCPPISYDQWCDDLDAIPEAEQKQFIIDTLRAKRNLHIFGKYFFPHIIKGKSEVPEAHLDLIRELSSPNHSAIIFPRGFAKTTWEKIDTIHDVIYKLEPVILYIGNSLGDAQLHFESIKTEFESNELLIDIYGDLVPPNHKYSKKWTNSHFETVNGVNVVARGAGKGRGVNIKHQRPTKIIFDDIEDDEQVASQVRRDKLHRWIYNVIFNARDKERGKIKFIGTVISPLCEVLLFYKSFGGIFRKAIEDGKSIWPEYWSLEALYKIRDGYVNEKGEIIKGIGTRAFSQEYLNTPINTDTAIIRPEFLEDSYYDNLRTEGMRIIMMFDPQSGSSTGGQNRKSADFYGLCVLAFFERELHRYVLELQTGRGTQIDQAALVVRTWQRYPTASFVGIEKIMTQVAVYQLILDWMAGKIDLPDVNNDNRNISIIAVSPEGKDKVARLQMHEAAFERKEIHLHQTMRTFAEKLTCFPAVEHDDDIDALIYCLEYANKTVSVINESGENEHDERDDSLTGNILKKQF